MHRNARTFVEKNHVLQKAAAFRSTPRNIAASTSECQQTKNRYLSCWEEQARLKSQAVHHFFWQKKTRWRRRWGDRHETHENVSTSWPSQHWLCFQHAANMLCFDFQIFKIQIWFVLFLLNAFFLYFDEILGVANAFTNSRSSKKDFRVQTGIKALVSTSTRLARRDTNKNSSAGVRLLSLATSLSTPGGTQLRTLPALLAVKPESHSGFGEPT